jgi:putative oxidoreductase
MKQFSLGYMLAHKWSYVHAVCAVCLGLFFIYAGAKKFMPRPASKGPADNEVFIQSLQQEHFDKPVTFKLTMKMFRASGFMKLIGMLQLASGLCILIPYTRLIGLLILLPVSINIFSFHLFMDNRMEENMETGFYMLTNLVLILYYFPRLKNLFIVKSNPVRS